MTYLEHKSVFGALSALCAVKFAVKFQTSITLALDRRMRSLVLRNYGMVQVRQVFFEQSALFRPR